MEDAVDLIIEKTRMNLCIECGRCAAVCPMGKIYEEFTFERFAHVILRQTLLKQAVWEREETWACHSCKACTEACPKGVKIKEFVDAIRILAIGKGVIKNCAVCERCGAYFSTKPIFDSIRVAVEGKKISSQFLTLCPQCRRYDFLSRIVKTL